MALAQMLYLLGPIIKAVMAKTSASGSGSISLFKFKWSFSSKAKITLGPRNSTLPLDIHFFSWVTSIMIQHWVTNINVPARWS